MTLYLGQNKIPSIMLQLPRRRQLHPHRLIQTAAAASHDVFDILPEQPLLALASEAKMPQDALKFLEKLLGRCSGVADSGLSQRETELTCWIWGRAVVEHSPTPVA